MKDNHWYPFYTGDYSRDTAHLSLLEHGAYRLLLDHYFATEKPLPNNPEMLYRICRARNQSERRAVMFAAFHFFSEDECGLHNKRADEEIAKRLRIKETNSANAKRRLSDGSAKPQAKPQRSEGYPQAQEQVQKAVRATALTYSADFEELWAAYPRKDGSKSDAFKSYLKATKEGESHGRIIGGIRAFAAQARRWGTDKKHIPHASTWINGRRWEADYSDAESGHKDLFAGSRKRSEWASETDDIIARRYGSAEAGGGKGDPNGDREALRPPETIREDSP